MKQFIRPKPEKVYVMVDLCMDRTGFMQPKSITWADGRTFNIEKIQDFRPASTAGNFKNGDCYTVLINGKLKNLYFEEAFPHFTGRIGRWFVVASVQSG